MPELSEDLGMWVYGIVRADTPDPPRRAGVDERHEVELIRDADLAAICSAVPMDEFQQEVLVERLEDLPRLEALVRAHERVLDDMLALGPLVPLRICTIYEGADHVRDMLEREHGALAGALEHLSGTAEWGVKAYLGAGREAPAPAQQAAAPRGRPASGIDYLTRKRDQRNAAEAARETADDAVEGIHRRLSELALDAVLSAPHDPRLTGRAHEILNASYLVPSARTDEFQSLVRGLTRRHEQDGLVLELTGPWPAYHFAGSAAAV
jgi:hypothetical protein